VEKILKTFPAVDQLLAGFATGDAISHEARILQKLFRAEGYRSDLFVDAAHAGAHMKTTWHPLEAYKPHPEKLLIYHYAGESPATQCFLSSESRKIIRYHNITPGHFFKRYDDQLAERLEKSRKELVDVCRQADALWAVSEYNAKEIRDLDVGSVTVFSLMFDPDSVTGTADPEFTQKIASDTVDVLFVGRLVPNKNIEELIQAFAVYHHRINPMSRLFIVGSEWSCPRYYTMLKLLSAEMSTQRIHFQGFVSAAHLPSYYEIADVFITTSLHEGYCLPVIEAMHKGVPVIARETGGIPEALGNAGVLYQNLSITELAELIHLVTSDPHWKERILASQQKRMAALMRRPIKREIEDLLRNFH
jgi:glycosyltransferase involved in cell wall biosynthesis